MFRNAITLPFRLFGIPFKLDRSFLLILPLFAWLIGSQVPAYVALLQNAGLDIDAAPLQQGIMPYVIGLIAALGLFSSVLIHELGHALTARLYGIQTKEITLWFLGGVAQLEEMPKRPGAEAVIAIAGPITSLLLAILFWLLWQSLGLSASLLFIFSYLTVTNVVLAVFNLLPALPLDGGRILRSLLALRFEYVRATQISANISRVIAILLGVYGLVSFQWMLLIVAFFVFNAVQAESQYAVVEKVLEGVLVRDLMTRDVSSVAPDMTIPQFAQLIYFKKHLGYPVVSDDGRLLGFACLKDAKGHDDGVVADIMTPADTIHADTEAMVALKRMTVSQIGRLVVVDSEEQMLGILSKTDLIRAIQLRSELAGTTPADRT